MYNSICDVEGIKVGHAQNKKSLTGCTVVLCGDGAIAGVDIRGSAPGTRETELLRPTFHIQKVHGILLTGGSAFGLDSAGGVQQYLEERNVGYDTPAGKVPIVPSAVIYDLMEGDSKVRPDKKMGYNSCLNAKSGKVEEGRIGVGTGATVGKFLGKDYCMKGGVGTCSEKIKGGVIIGALVVVNSVGNIIENGKIIAGAKNPAGRGFVDALEFFKIGKVSVGFGTNTTLGIVATNAKFNKEEINKVAQMSQNGLVKAISPVHTMYDGDLIFALSSGDKKSDVNVVGTIAGELIYKAIIRAVKVANRNLSANL
jgi:L-aminopeptidase/D-esterase-like protein